MTDDAATILLAEDDDATRAFLADNLTADGYAVVCAETGRDFLRLAAARFPDLALVDVGLPDASGFELVERVRAADGVASRVDPALPVVLVSGRGGELDRIRGLDRGADDYVVKPFAYPELRARVAAVLRRSQRRARAGRLRVGAVELDPASREVTVGGERVELSQKEFALLRHLMTEPTRVWTKQEILRQVWGFRAPGHTRTLDSHACRLRAKLGVHGERYVVNVWGVGYRLVDGPVTEAAA